MVIAGTAYNIAAWGLFFSTEAAASAALTGLLFVSISINLQEIVKNPALTARSGKALSTLAAVLILSTLCLVPGQSTRILGIELIVGGILIWTIVTVLQHRATHNNPYVNRATRAFHTLLTQGSALPVIAGAVSLMLGRGGGFYWLVASTLLSFVSALLDAWVLLIEILR